MALTSPGIWGESACDRWVPTFMGIWTGLQLVWLYSLTILIMYCQWESDMIHFVQSQLISIPRMVLISPRSLILTYLRNSDLTVAISFLELQNSPRLWMCENVIFKFSQWINPIWKFEVILMRMSFNLLYQRCLACLRPLICQGHG